MLSKNAEFIKKLTLFSALSEPDLESFDAFPIKRTLQS